MGMSDQLHALAALPQGKKHLTPITRKMGWSQSWLGYFEEEIHLLCPCRESIDDSTDVQTTAVTVPTMLSRLVFLCITYCTCYAYNNVFCNEVCVFGKELVQ
jgi:hypothetical protein